MSEEELRDLKILPAVGAVLITYAQLRAQLPQGEAFERAWTAAIDAVETVVAMDWRLPLVATVAQTFQGRLWNRQGRPTTAFLVAADAALRAHVEHTATDEDEEFPGAALEVALHGLPIVAYFALLLVTMKVPLKPKGAPREAPLH